MMTSDEFKKISKIANTHWWYVGTRHAVVSIIKKYIPNRNLKIFDIGCGTGDNMISLKKFGSVEGADISDLAIKLANEKGLNCFTSDLRKLNLKPSKYDLITTFEVISQLKEDELPSIFSEKINKSLKPGGYYLLREPAFQFAYGGHDIAIGAKTRFSKNQLKEMLNKAGFEVVYTTYFNTLLFPLIILKRKLDVWFNPNQKYESDVSETPEPINKILLAILKLESKIIEFFPLPFGVSIIMLARKSDS